MKSFRIGFKSGNEVIVRAKDVAIHKVPGEKVTQIKWEDGPTLLFIALDQIEYVLEA